MGILSEIAKELQISVEDLDLALHVITLTAGAATGNGAASASTVEVGWVPFSSFRVVGVGALITGNGATTKAEALQFGYPVQDYGAADEDAFGQLNQDTDDGDQWTAGDIIYHGEHYTPTAEANGGVTTYTDPGSAALFNVKLKGPMLIEATKKNVADSTATCVPFVIVRGG